MKSDKKLEKEINGLSYEIMNALINQPDIQKKFQQCLDLTYKDKQQATSDILKIIDESILNNEERNVFFIKQNVRWELEELKQKIQGVKGE